MMIHKIVAKFCVLGAITLTCVTLYATAFIPEIPLWLGIAASAMLAAPLLVIGFRLESQSGKETDNLLAPLQRIRPWLSVILRKTGMSSVLKVTRQRLGFVGFDAKFGAERSKKVSRARQAAQKHWELAILATLAFSLAYFFAYHNHPEPIAANSYRRNSGTAKMLVWCHENLNTVVTAWTLVGSSASALYLYRIVRH